MTSTHVFPKKEDVEIIVGDEKQPDFYPRMKIKRWDNEVNFSIGIISTFQGSHNKVGDIVEWNDGHGIGAKFYQKPGDKFEFEISLDERPLTGFVLLSIDTKGLDFFYQRSLTQKEIDNGNIRPDNVVGSYAVYHKTMKGNYIGGNNYRAGKFCHIYRPNVTDANNKQLWCDMEIIGSVMKIIIPDGLVYPVVIDPTFGNTNAGASIDNFGAHTLLGSVFTSPADAGTAQSVSFCVYSSDGPTNYKGVIVLHSNLNIITNGIGNGSYDDSDSEVWVESDFATDPSLTPSTDYVLMLIADQQIMGYYDDGATDQFVYDDTNYYDSPSNPTDASTYTYKISIYCTYTAAAAGLSIPVAMHHLIQQRIS